MKKRVFKMIMCMALVCIMLFAMYGCGQQDTGDATQATGDAQATGDVQAPDETRPSVADMTMGEYLEDPVGFIRSQRYDELVTLTSFKWEIAAWTFPEGQSVHDNGYSRFIEEHLNIRVEYDWVVDVSQYETRLSLALASGDLPDFFYVDPATFIMLQEDGLIADMTDVFTRHASPRTREITDFFPEGFNSAIDADGNLMGLPQMGAGTIAIPTILWVRSDWMDAAGLDAPSTMDELIDMAVIFMDDFGASYGIAVDRAMFGGINSILGVFNAFHAHPNIWLRDEATGELVFGSIQPEVKTALQALQDMYRDGIISAEFGVKDTGRVNEDIINGEVGIMFGLNWAGYWPFNDAVRANPEAIWRPMSVPSADSNPLYYQGPWPVTSYVVASRNSNFIEAAIKMANAFNVVSDDPSYFLPGDVGAPWQSGPLWFEDPSSDYINHVALADAVSRMDPSNLTVARQRDFEQIMLWVEDGNPDGFGYYAQLTGHGSFGVIRPYVNADRIRLSEMRGAEPPGLAAVASTLNQLQETFFTRIIMGEPIELFDQFVSDWLAMGGEAGTIEVNEMYNR